MGDSHSIKRNRHAAGSQAPVEAVVVVFDSDPERLLRRKLREQQRNQKRSQHVPQIEFVNSSTGNPTVHKASSKLIRAHVMRDYLWRKKQSGRPKHHPTEVSPWRNALFGTDAAAVPPPIGLGNAIMYPITMNARTHSLLQYFFEIVVEDWEKEDLLRLSLADGALFHMVLLSSAMQLNHFNSNPNALENDFHKMSAIKLVKERLHDVANDNHLVPDSIILTVAFLAISDALIKDYDMCAIHVNGLYKMIDMRGGLENLSLQLQYRIRMLV
ncbi:hypothetical protein F5884DRAFT_748710 [Xylogone sp. PMI_703]|nr:hypothetical protein F5884DRAFT_748710 [Xylogone sp. PMI_703]